MSDRNPSNEQSQNDGKNPVGLTARQAEVLAALENLIATKGYSPSYAEIGAAVGISARVGIKIHVDRLVMQGLVTRDGDTPRTLVRTSRPYYVKTKAVA